MSSHCKYSNINNIIYFCIVRMHDIDNINIHIEQSINMHCTYFVYRATVFKKHDKKIKPQRMR